MTGQWLPSSIGQLKWLEHLDARSSGLTGELPSFHNTTSLREINLHGNTFYGNLPPEMALHKRLSTMDFSFNNFNNTIPQEWGVFDVDSVALPYLQRLYLNNNGLYGLVPGNLIHLSLLPSLHIRLQQNYFSGFMPAFLQYTKLFEAHNNNWACPLPVHW